MYIDGFDGIEGILKDFEAPPEALLDAHVLYAKYRHESYEGMAFVLFMKDKKMYEVQGSHCSCNGLEGQWGPEETSREALEFRFFGEDCDWPYACESEEDKDALRQAVLTEIAETILLRN